MKAYKVEILVIDHEGYGQEEIKNVLEDSRYINASVKTVTVVDIGEWSDQHPLNSYSTCGAEYNRLFNQGE